MIDVLGHWNVLRCRIGWHSWIYFGAFDMQRGCRRCERKQYLHGDLWTWFDRWI